MAQFDCIIIFVIVWSVIVILLQYFKILTNILTPSFTRWQKLNYYNWMIL